MEKLIDLIEIQSQKYGDKIAIIFEGEKLTYFELNEKVNLLAYKFASNWSGQVISILSEKSINAVVTFLAIIKSGNIAEFLDSTEKIVSTKKPLFYSNLKSKFIEDKTNCLNFDDFDKLPESDELSICGTCFQFSSSGTIGTKKTYKFTDKGMLEILPWLKRNIYLDECHNFASLTRFHSYISLVDLFLPLYLGKTLYIIPENHLVLPNDVPDYIENWKIDFIQTPPSIIKNLKADHHLKVIVSTTETMSEDLFSKVSHSAFIYNLFGQTETNSYLIHKVQYKNELNCVGKIENSFNELEIINDILEVKGSSLYKGSKEWFKTNDILEEKNGFYFFKGRSDEKFKIKDKLVDLNQIRNFLKNKYKSEFTVAAMDEYVLILSEVQLGIDERFYKDIELKIKKGSTPRLSNGKIDYQKIKQLYS